jgi:hypothetical protein
VIAVALPVPARLVALRVLELVVQMVGPWKLDHLLSDLQVFDLGSIRPVPVELLRWLYPSR